MFNSIIGTFKSVRKAFSEANEMAKIEEERKKFARKARRMIEDLKNIIDQLGSDPEDAKCSKIYYHHGSSKIKQSPLDDHYKRENHANFQVDKLKKDFDNRAFPIKCAVTPGMRQSLWNYKTGYSTCIYAYNRDLDKLIRKKNSDEVFIHDLEKFSKKIEEDKNENIRLNIAFNEHNKNFSSELESELKEIYYKLYRYSNYSINNFVNELKDIDVFNLLLRLIEIKEKIGALPQNSMERNKIESAMSRVSQEKSASKENDEDNGNIGHQSSAIKKFSQQQKISKLIHFTNHKNLNSILKNGILPVTRLNETSNEHYINDFNRWDNCLDAISLSISHPNQLMFYKYRNMNIHENWVVLTIDPKVLWKKKCAFCWHNAADSRIRKIPIEERKKNLSFKKMFSDVTNVPSRLEQNLSTYYPTDVQAEVLVFDKIDVGLIKEVVFDNTFLEKNFNQSFPFIKTVYNSHDRQYFGFRDNIDFF